MRYGEFPSYTPDDVIEELVFRTRGGRIPTSSTVDRIATVHASSSQPEIFEQDERDVEHEEHLWEVFDEYVRNVQRQKPRTPSIGDTLRSKDQMIKFE